MKRFRVVVYFLPVFLILIILIFQFVINTKYKFRDPHPFEGEYLYNPYEGMDSLKWKKANFHAHTRMFFGLTDGAANSGKALDSIYRYFDYDIIGISNYQNIDKFESNNKWFIPVYEHGYQYYKNHQLVINAKKVSWLDYVFRQTLSNKQTIIDNLKKDTSVILTIVHPGPRQAYTFNDLKYLTNYDCLEIASSYDQFISQYDTILSAGHPVFLMANDDVHDLNSISDGCHSYNLINTDLIRDSVLHSIKSGRLVGVKLNVDPYETNEEKRAGMQKLPEIVSVTVNNDTLTVKLNNLVKTIKFIGQNGTERKIIANAALGSFIFSEQDKYIRTEIECQDRTIYFLNPVFRYNGIQLSDYISSPDMFKTWLWRSVVFILLLLIFAAVRIKKRSGSGD